MKQARTTFTVCLIGMITSYILFASCNSSGDKKETGDSTVVIDTARKESSDTSQKTTATGILPTVSMTRQNFIDVFRSNYPDRVVDMIYFQYNEAAGDNSLRAYGADGDGQDLNNPINLSVVPDGPTLSTNEEIKYDQQITLGNMRGFLGLSTGTQTRINNGQFKAVVWLVPCTTVDSNGETLIYYRITEPQNQSDCPPERAPNAEGRISSNPSPPAKPCNEEPGGCLSALYKKKYTKKELYEAYKKITR